MYCIDIIKGNDLWSTTELNVSLFNIPQNTNSVVDYE